MDVEKKLVCPGERVGHVEDCDAGEGTYIRGPYIHSSIIGVREATIQDDRTIVNVVRDENPNSILVPELHSVVTARVWSCNNNSLKNLGNKSEFSLCKCGHPLCWIKTSERTIFGNY